MSSRKPRTRAHALGVSQARLRSASARKVVKIKLLLMSIAADWNDIDSAVEFECDALRDQGLAALETTLDDALGLLLEPAEYPEAEAA